jgi:hypothetical protein
MCNCTGTVLRRGGGPSQLKDFYKAGISSFSEKAF